jgi:hypothetical protein
MLALMERGRLKVDCNANQIHMRINLSLKFGLFFCAQIIDLLVIHEVTHSARAARYELFRSVYDTKCTFPFVSAQNLYLFKLRNAFNNLFIRADIVKMLK